MLRLPTPTEFNSSFGNRLMAMAAKDSGIVPTGLFIQSLNELIDDQEKRLTAVRNRVPNIVPAALWLPRAGMGVRSSRLPAYVMIFLICAVILLI